jgi:hypothetical protein
MGLPQEPMTNDPGSHIKQFLILVVSIKAMSIFLRLSLTLWFITINCLLHLDLFSSNSDFSSNSIVQPFSR